MPRATKLEDALSIRTRLFGVRRVRLRWAFLPATFVAVFVALWGLPTSPQTAILTAAYLAVVIVQWTKPSVAEWAVSLAPWLAYGVVSLYWYYWIREHLRVPIDSLDVTNGVAFAVGGLVALSHPWPRDRQDTLLEVGAALAAVGAFVPLFLWSALRGAL